MPDDPTRCPWPGHNPLLRDYHDREWGVPLRDDRKLFEHLLLESFQAGLSWLTVLRKREAFRKAFAGFDAEAVATFGEAKVRELLTDAGIVRNEAKIRAAIGNARAFLRVQEEQGSFAAYSWAFVGDRAVVNEWTDGAQVPARTELSDRLAHDLRRRGFRFVGSTVVYAHMQATGMVNDHLLGCFRHAQLREAAAAPGAA